MFGGKVKFLDILEDLRYFFVVALLKILVAFPDFFIFTNLTLGFLEFLQIILLGFWCET